MTETKKRRCDQKIITPQTIALRKIRGALGLDRKKAALMLERSPKWLEKVENGRVELKASLVAHFLKSYQVSQKAFEKAVEGFLSTMRA